MEKIEHYYQIVEEVISSLGVDPSKCRSNPGQWDLKRGSASIWVDVWKLDNDDYGYIQLMAPVCDIPETNTQAFYQELLEINHQLYGCAMTKFENRIYIKAIRELEGIEGSEVRAMFDRVGYYADQYDDELKNKFFGGRRE